MKPSPAVIAHSLFAAAVLSTAFAVADGHGANHDQPHDHKHADNVTGPDILGVENADPSEMMQKWMATMQPSKGHEFLKRFEGNWKAKNTVWMDPSAPPMVTDGYSTNELIYNGKFVKGTYQGNFMGQPFEGTSILGFDNIRKQFTSIWFDSMSTAFSPSFGMVDVTGNTLTMIATMDEPMTGEINKHYKQVFTFQNEDAYTMEMIEILYGDEFTVMKLEYTRAN